jgi:hypothetical protein
MEVLKLLGLSSLGESSSLLEELKPAVYILRSLLPAPLLSAFGELPSFLGELKPVAFIITPKS